MNSVIATFNLADIGRPRETPVADAQPVVLESGQSQAFDDGRLALNICAATTQARVLRVDGKTLLIVGAPKLALGDSTRVTMLRLVEAMARNPLETLRGLRGPFVMLFADSDRGDFIWATDRAATRSPCYAVRTDMILIGLNARDVERAGNVVASIRAQGIYDYLYFHVIPAPATVFEGIHRLLPGEYLHLAREGPRVSSYWQPEYGGPAGVRDFAGAKTELRGLLEDAVRSQIGTGKTGTFLSGGTDSSTIAGVLGVVTGEPADTFSIGFDVPGFDEMAYARIAARHFHTRHHEHYVTADDLLHSIPKVAASYDQPFGNSSAVAAYECALFARTEGVDKLLGGDGGDELFGGNTRYAKQKVFDAYRTIPNWLARGVAEPLLLGPGIARRLPLVRKARSYVEQAIVPMPARMQSYNLLSRIGIQRIFKPAFLAAIDSAEPSMLEQQYYARCTSTSLVNRMLHFDWKFTLADNDLPKVVGSCDLAEVVAGFPLLDERIVDFANRLPVDWKVKGLQLRHFFKAALTDFLPPEIIAKKKHGFGLPFGQWLIEHETLRRYATGCLESFRDRGVVQPEFVDELMRPRLAEHTTFYGEMVWILMMLEEWLCAHRPQYSFA